MMNDKNVVIPMRVLDKPEPVYFGTRPAPRTTPKECRRSSSCQPLHTVVSDDGDTFICCGLHQEGGCDPYRFCFKTLGTDTVYDYDLLDAMDTIEVLSRAVLSAKRLQEVT